MAQTTIHTDDFDTDVAATHLGVKLTFEDSTVLLDLSDENYDDLASVLKAYLEAGAAPKKSKRREDAPAVRLWALQQERFADGAKGRGRLSNEVYAAYDAQA